MDWMFLFVVTVWKMRKAQQTYFKARNSTNLIEAKRYEKLVDDELKKRLLFAGEVPIALQGNDVEIQPGLFE